MSKHTTIAVDLAKSVFEVAVSERPGRVSERHRLSRTAFVRFLAEHQPATVLLEACGSAHYWGRKAESFGHRPVLLPPHGVRPYVLRNKTDRSDARALLEARRNDDLHPVPVKTVAQQALTALHRSRSAWLATRTARLNLVRGVLREFGITIPVGARHVLPRLGALLQDPESDVPQCVRPALENTASEIRELEERISAVERQLRDLARDMPLVSSSVHDPGHRLHYRHSARRFRRRHSQIPLRPPFRELPRPHPTGTLERPRTKARGHQQTRRCVSADAPDPRCARSALARSLEAATRSPARLGPSRAAAARPQQGRDRTRQQARPHRLGRLVEG